MSGGGWEKVSDSQESGQSTSNSAKHFVYMKLMA